MISTVADELTGPGLLDRLRLLLRQLARQLEDPDRHPAHLRRRSRHHRVWLPREPPMAREAWAVQ